MVKRPWRGVLRAAAFLALTGILLVVFLLAMALGGLGTDRLRRLWCRGSAWIVGIRTGVAGRPFADCPTLFVANHVSYLDILVLGAQLDATFIAKAEVATWPLFGLLGRITHTFFVRRHWGQALVQRNALAARMRAGESFILFAEGTSGNGLAVHRLKTSLLSVAEPWVLDCPIAVQGVTLAYVRLADGTPVDHTNCDRYGWYGDAELLPHLWDVLQMSGVEVRTVLHEPALSWSVQSRKIVGRELREQIGHQLALAHAAAGEPAPTGLHAEAL
jgi:1-acyl-sn-glycerol-3-phosphate acyltransferase